MELSDFPNGYTFISLSHDIFYAHILLSILLLFERSSELDKKLCCVNKNNILHTSYVAHQNDVIHKRKKNCGNKKLCDTQEERLMSTKYV